VRKYACRHKSQATNIQKSTNMNIRSLRQTYTQRGNAYTACVRSFCSTSISFPAMPPKALGARVSRESRSVAVAPMHPAAAAKRAMTGNKKLATSIRDSPPQSTKTLANKKIQDQVISHERTPVASVVHKAAETTPASETRKSLTLTIR
jgi:hypothetical protein